MNPPTRATNFAALIGAGPAPPITLLWSGFHLTVERDWFWFWFWFWFWIYYALWLASIFTLVLVLRQSSENRSNQITYSIL